MSFYLFEKVALFNVIAVIWRFPALLESRETQSGRPLDIQGVSLIECFCRSKFHSSCRWQPLFSGRSLKQKIAFDLSGVNSGRGKKTKLHQFNKRRVLFLLPLAFTLISDFIDHPVQAHCRNFIAEDDCRDHVMSPF